MDSLIFGKGIVTFDSFIAELKLAKVIKETGLNPEELLAVKNAFEEARTLVKDEKLVAELEKAIAENDVAKVKSLLGEEIGRVKKPAGELERYKTFSDNSYVPSRYSSDPRFNDLATDPAHVGNKSISAASRQEAMAGLEAESQGLIKGPIERGPAEIEFYDANGSPFDVKTPPSKSSKVPVDMDHSKVGMSIKKELSIKPMFPNKITGVLEKRRVILDCSYMNEVDHRVLWNWLNANLNTEELSRIIEINVKFK